MQIGSSILVIISSYFILSTVFAVDIKFECLPSTRDKYTSHEVSKIQNILALSYVLLNSSVFRLRTFKSQLT